MLGEAAPKARLGLGFQCMCSDSHDAGGPSAAVGAFLAGFKKEVDAATRPTHASIGFTEGSKTALLRGQSVEQLVEPRPLAHADGVVHPDGPYQRLEGFSLASSAISRRAGNYRAQPSPRLVLFLIGNSSKKQNIRYRALNKRRPASRALPRSSRLASVWCRAPNDSRSNRTHGNTRVGTLRETYGERFAADFRGDAHLRTVLDRTGAQSLSRRRQCAISGRSSRVAPNWSNPD